MRAAALALVLIVGAAVVLSFANTLNSWVVGGLIGGLAALLISIPISLLLFSHFSRRHDEQLKAELEEGFAFVQPPDYLEPPEQVYDADGYVISPEEYGEYEEQAGYVEENNYRIPTPRQLPAAGQSYASSERAFQQRESAYRPVTGPTRQQVGQTGQQVQGGFTESVARRKKTTPHHLPAAQQGTPRDYDGANARRSRHHTAALRAAMREAAQQQDDPDVNIFPTTPGNVRRGSSRSSQPLTEQPARPMGQRPSRRQSPQTTTNQYRSGHSVDATPPQSSGRRSSPPEEGGTTSQPLQRGFPQFRDPRQLPEPHTDQLGEQYPQTGPVGPKYRTTGQMARNPRLDEQPRDPERITGSLKNPLVRRAPYLYENDPLRQQFAQQIDRPVKRRSSRLESAQYEEEEG